MNYRSCISILMYFYFHSFYITVKFICVAAMKIIQVTEHSENEIMTQLGVVWK